LGVYLYNIGVKQRCIALFYKLGVIILYTGLAKIQKELEKIGKVCVSTFKGLNEMLPLLQTKGIIKISQL